MSNWRNRMHPQVSTAEIEVFKQLQKEGLTACMVTQKPIALKKKQGKIKRQTIPDFWWLNTMKTAYLDGEPCHSGNQAELDLEIAGMLKRKGFKVRRIPYQPGGFRGCASCGEFERVMVELREFIGEP